jgi:pSer/pThr/pTyr-binding forkhead associated (FHA) protein
MPTLTIELPGLPPVAHVLKDDTISVGRMKGNTIVIEDASISLMHARITRKNGEYYLKDLNSTNGTVVNGQPISEAKLQDLDRLRFAEITAQFHGEAPAPTGQASPTPVVSLPIITPPAQLPPAPFALKAGPAAAPPVRPRVFSVAPYIGGVAVLAVLSALGWRFWRANVETTHKARGLAPALALAAVNRVSTNDQPKAVALRAPPESNTVPGLTGQDGQVAENAADLVKALKDQDPAQRQRAAKALHALGPEVKEATPALREALKDTDPEVQMWAALALINGKCYDKAAVPVLVQILQHDNPTMRQVACLSLGLIPYAGSEKEAVVPALAETAGKDVDNDVRQAAITALNIIAPEVIGKEGRQ